MRTIFLLVYRVKSVAGRKKGARRRKKIGKRLSGPEGRLVYLQRGLLSSGFKRKIRCRIRKRGGFGVDGAVRESLDLQIELLSATNPYRRRENDY